MAVQGFEIGLVSASRRLVDVLVDAFDLEELDPIEITPEIVALLPAAEPGTQYRLAFQGGVLKVTVPATPPAPRTPVGSALDTAGLRYLTVVVDDLDRVSERMTAHGGAVRHAPSGFLPGVRIALLEDPDGNLYEVVEHGG